MDAGVDVHVLWSTDAARATSAIGDLTSRSLRRIRERGRIEPLHIPACGGSCRHDVLQVLSRAAAVAAVAAKEVGSAGSHPRNRIVAPTGEVRHGVARVYRQNCADLPAPDHLVQG